MVRISFRNKHYLASGRPKNPDADLLSQAIKDEYENYVKTAEPSSSSSKTARKSLKVVQKNLVDLPVGGRLEVKLSNMVLGDGGILILTRALQRCKNLRSLSLIKCGVDGESISLFAKLIHSLSQLEELNLSGNILTNAGATILFSSITSSSQLSSLKLSGIGLSDDGTAAFLELLAATRTSLSVDLSKNCFSTVGIDRMLAVARKNIFVIGLNLEGSGINETQSKQLYEILGKNESVAGVIERLLINACRRNFKTRLISFRESVQQNRCADDANIETTGPVYKWLQKSKMSLYVQADTPSQRFQIGTCLDIGRRNEMQDVICIKGSYRSDKNQDLFCLFDGHGGREAATYCAERIPVLLAENLSKPELDPMTALKDTFLKCNKEMAAWSTMTGTTAVLALMLENKRYIANLGDSKAVLSQRGTACFVSRDHKATDLSEQQRVVDLGGQIVDGRVNGKLSITRALGDSNLAPFVSPLPDVYEQNLTKQDEFLILASDGIWDVLTPEDVVRLVVARQKKTTMKESDNLEAKMLAEMIKEEAYNRGSLDNISVVVIIFPGFGRLRRTRKKSDALLGPSSVVAGSIIRSPSADSQLSSKLSDLEPLYTASDSELPSLKDELEDEDQEAPKFGKTYRDDSALDLIKAQYSDISASPIANSFRMEVLSGQHKYSRSISGNHPHSSHSRHHSVSAGIAEETTQELTASKES